MNEFTIIYEGQQLSINKLRSLHWRDIKKKVDPIKLHAFVICNKFRNVKMKAFTVEARYNSDLDVENTAATIKIFMDQLVKMGVFPNDSKKHWRGLNIIPDETLKHNSLHLKVTECTSPLP